MRHRRIKTKSPHSPRSSFARAGQGSPYQSNKAPDDDRDLLKLHIQSGNENDISSMSGLKKDRLYKLSKSRHRLGKGDRRNILRAIDKFEAKRFLSMPVMTQEFESNFE